MPRITVQADVPDGQICNSRYFDCCKYLKKYGWCNLFQCSLKSICAGDDTFKTRKCAACQAACESVTNDQGLERTIYRRSEEEAIEAWNTRVSEDKEHTEKPVPFSKCNSIKDDFDVIWLWDGKRVCVASEAADPDNGYSAESYEEAFRKLIVHGYIKAH